ncbi:uncharacterized protein AB9X84_017981 [Acanthopagrus schlegelii]
MFINRGKETARELDWLRKNSDEVTLSKAKIAAQVRDETKRRNKKDPQIDYEELKVAYLINEEKYRAALQEEKDKNKLLQEELDQISASHTDNRLRYEADVTEVRQPDLQVITNLRAEQDDLCHRMTEEIGNLQQNALEKEKCCERQLEELKTQLAVQTSLNHELSSELKASKEAEVPEEKPCEQESIATASVTELLDVTEVSEETHQGKPKKSPWKRACHSLGTEETTEGEEASTTQAVTFTIKHQHQEHLYC